MTNNNTIRSLCPRCNTRHESASACPGITTETQTQTGTTGPLLAQAESLFESYLAARLVRARRNLTEAKIALLRDPRSKDKRDALLRAESEAQRLELQLLEQARRAAKARDRASESTNVSPITASNVSTQPTEDFRTLQAAKADITVAANGNSSTKSSAEAFLSEDELAALRAAKSRSKAP